MSFPAVTLRDSMERPEALEVGLLADTGRSISQDYQSGDFSLEVMKF
jgi:UDP-N-acetylglucosamine 2-epimerase